MQNTRIKFCGITRAEDVKYAVSLGVHALGFVFCANSPRSVDPDLARELVAICPPFITCVGLFMNQEASTINDILSVVALDLLQFHGDESEQFCASFGRSYIKSIAMGEETGFDKLAAYPSAKALLLDSNKLGQPGGSGKVFDWNAIPSAIDKPIVLAGGLDDSNVAAAIEAVRPYAVDVSSGIESSKGVKDKNKMSRFVTSVRVAHEC